MHTPWQASCGGGHGGPHANVPPAFRHSLLGAEHDTRQEPQVAGVSYGGGGQMGTLASAEVTAASGAAASAVAASGISGIDVSGIDASLGPPSACEVAEASKDASLGAASNEGPGDPSVTNGGVVLVASLSGLSLIHISEPTRPY